MAWSALQREPVPPQFQFDRSSNVVGRARRNYRAAGRVFQPVLMHVPETTAGSRQMTADEPILACVQSECSGPVFKTGVCPPGLTGIASDEGRVKAGRRDQRAISRSAFAVLVERLRRVQAIRDR
jgi:hypothetical protein